MAWQTADIPVFMDTIELNQKESWSTERAILWTQKEGRDENVWYMFLAENLGFYFATDKEKREGGVANELK